MPDRLKGLLGQLGKTLGVTEAAGSRQNPFLKSEEDQFNMASQRADIPSPSADFADKSRVAKNTGYGLVQSMMRDFDPSSNEDVLQMQRAMNAAGIKGADGKPLAEDGMLGKNTMRALRFAQGQADTMQDALPLREFGEPQGGVGPSYEGMYNEDSRDMDKVENNPIDRSKRYDPSQRGEVKRYGGRGTGINRFGTPQGGRFY